MGSQLTRNKVLRAAPLLGVQSIKQKYMCFLPNHPNGLRNPRMGSRKPIKHTQLYLNYIDPIKNKQEYFPASFKSLPWYKK